MVGMESGLSLPFFFFDVDAPQRLWTVAAAGEQTNGGQLLPVGAPHLLVNPRCAVALVGGDSLDGQDLGGIRVSEQPVQGPGLAAAFFIDCLCNTHLQSSDLLPDLSPGEGLPILALGRGRTNRSKEIDCHIAFPR
jgi:hypothetical protein